MKLLGLVVFYFLEISNCQVPPIEGIAYIALRVYNACNC